ncbi:MAG TPA: porin [Longimicrobiaceae bacterium]
MTTTMNLITGPRARHLLAFATVMTLASATPGAAQDRSTLVSPAPAPEPQRTSAATADSAAASVIATADESGFGLRSSDGAFALQFRGGAQYDGRVFPDDPEDAAIDGFELRRLRADLRGTVYHIYDFRVNLDYAGNRVEVLDAYLDARFAPALQIRAGKFKAPVGLERLQSLFALTFAERGFPTALAPNRDVGIQLSGSLGGSMASYQVGVFNGVADGASGDQDLSDSKDLAARIFLQPFSRSGVEALSGLGIGIAGTVGEQEGTADSPGLAAPRTPLGRLTFHRFLGDGTPTGTVIADGRRTRLSPQGYWYWRNLGVLGEYIRSQTEVSLEAQQAEVSQSAWQLAASWVLTGEDASYRGVIPSRPLDFSRGGWGAWEVAGRFQALETDDDAFPALADPLRAAQRAKSFTLGFNWYLNRNVRFLTNYERTRFDAAPGGTHLPTESVFASRIQVAF